MSWHQALFIGVAMLAATATANAHMGGMGGRSSGDFHGSHGFHPRPLPFHFHQRNLRVAFPDAGFGSARSEGWGGGAYSAGLAGFDYDEADDFAPEDLHFRVQDSFGPGDIGRPSPPPQPYDYGPWEAARMDPWHGYEPDDW
jgi:hypothetical protein